MPEPTLDAPAAPARSHEHRVVVALAIPLAVVIFVVAAGVLYYRWATMREPTCVLIVEGNEALRGAEIEVDGLDLTEPHRVTIGGGDRFAIPFYLEPGRYSVMVTLKEKAVFRGEVVLTPVSRGKRVDLTRFTPGTSVAPAPPPQPPLAIPSLPPSTPATTEPVLP